ncbi:uncharacterized protein LOC141651695 [Silene latifolia]|uniref:uncharacterized protein LOC141651695 n=1 Tax=Silene latifolia TaxID=37657 RepID=UPI003D777B2C
MGSEVLLTGSFCNESHVLSLSTPITKEEIKGVVFSIPIDKAPGPDGYTSGFFRDSWDIVGDKVCNAIMDFFATGRLLTLINATNITLIPKCDRPTAISHFRPIACCNLVYKVISKLLCNRLASVLPDLVHENKRAFIKGRSIIENVFICQNIIHMYGRKAVIPRCLFKIDLQKAYDTVEWDFVEQMLHGLKFPAHFTHLVMQCMAIPISPPLQESEAHSSHLMFADDLILFCKGKPQSIWLLMRAFSSFSNASGLSMNNAKSEIFFNGVNEDIREGIKQAQMFIIPKSIINRIIVICRNYLWDGSPDYHRVPLMAWDKVTLPKKEGGLGIKKADVWNVATVGKLVNWVYCKADRLWIKWINDVYIKNQDWHNYSPPSDATWVWKNICKVKEKLKDGFINNIWTSSSKGYTIKGGYKWLCPTHMTLNWSAIVWNNWNIPKHSLTTWLRMHEGMNVKSKLFRFGCCEDYLCWYGGSFPTVDSLIAENRNIIQWRIKVAMFNAFHYFIWFQRNNARINEWLLRPDAVARRIEEDTKHRVKQKFRAVDDQNVSLWLQSMGVI